MRKKIFLIIPLTLIVLNVKSQIIELDVSNPFPRLGDGVEIKMNVLKSPIKDTAKVITTESAINAWENNYGSGSLTLTKMIDKTGSHVFGPFSIVVNDKIYKSDKITLEVSEALPNQKNGIWIRQGKFKNQEYLVIEQRISGETKKTNTGPNSISMEFVPKSDNFVEIDEDAIGENQIGFNFSYSSTGTQSVKDESSTYASQVSYKISVYKINKRPGFKKSFKLTKSHLKNTPSDISFAEFIVQ